MRFVDSALKESIFDIMASTIKNEHECYYL